MMRGSTGSTVSYREPVVLCSITILHAHSIHVMVVLGVESGSACEMRTVLDIEHA